MTRNLFNRRGLFIVGLLLFGLVRSAAAEPAKVMIDNFAFTPAVLQVKAGTAVTFLNRDDIPHSVVAAAGAFHSPALDTDESFTYTFAKTGEFIYVCGLHPFMKGKIVVVP
jgi:plastocyanin